MKLLGVTSIYDPGCHCAFTDIISWRDRIYVAFREALNHSIQYSGQIVVLGSADYGRSFQVHARLADGYDLRDPHFFTAGDRLGLTISSWIVPDPDRGIAERVRTGHLAQSDNGVDWDLRRMKEPRGRTLWRPRRGPDGALYSAGYAPSDSEDDYQVELYRSENGWDWNRVSVIHPDQKANETELCFLPDGRLLALVRREQSPHRPLLARAKPPYEQWTKVDCSRWLQGPLLERLPDGRLLVVGRSPDDVDDESSPKRTTRAFELDAETGRLDPLLALPSGGDTSYAGFLDLGGGEALLSYYSGHGYENGSYRKGSDPQRCGIYLARLVL